jgi:hypothetical protein
MSHTVCGRWPDPGAYQQLQQPMPWLATRGANPWEAGGPPHGRALAAAGAQHRPSTGLRQPTVALAIGQLACSYISFARLPVAPPQGRCPQCRRPQGRGPQGRGPAPQAVHPHVVGAPPCWGEGAWSCLHCTALFGAVCIALNPLALPERGPLWRGTLTVCYCGLSVMETCRVMNAARLATEPCPLCVLCQVGGLPSRLVRCQPDLL